MESMWLGYLKLRSAINRPLQITFKKLKGDDKHQKKLDISVMVICGSTHNLWRSGFQAGSQVMLADYMDAEYLDHDGWADCWVTHYASVREDNRPPEHECIESFSEYYDKARKSAMILMGIALDRGLECSVELDWDGASVCGLSAWNDSIGELLDGDKAMIGRWLDVQMRRAEEEKIRQSKCWIAVGCSDAD
jgi:hypothetical protein